jgi:hypothetical protein
MSMDQEEGNPIKTVGRKNRVPPYIGPKREGFGRVFESRLDFFAK